jgi:hypothetical protein
MAGYGNLRPPYPKYWPQRFSGDLPAQFGPPDLWPSMRNPAYNMYTGVRGRNLAGLGQAEKGPLEVQGAPLPGADMQSADGVGIRDYANELDVLAAADDVVGNGLFDPPGTAGNVHPDYGVFADHVNLPGFIMRDQFYAPSEVIDATTGNQVMYVPGGAVAIDAAQRNAFENRNLWTLPPGVNPWPIIDVDQQSSVIPDGAAWPVGQTETEAQEPTSGWHVFAITAVAGISVGLLAALVWPKKR